MVSDKNVKVSQKRCLGTSIESFTDPSPSEQIIECLFDLKFCFGSCGIWQSYGIWQCCFMLERTKSNKLELDCKEK